MVEGTGGPEIEGDMWVSAECRALSGTGLSPPAVKAR